MIQHLFTHVHALQWKRVFAGACITVCIVSSGAFALPKKADAAGIVFDPTNFIKNTVTAAQTAVNTGLLSALNIKEFTLDGIAWSLAKKVLAQTTQSVIDWINSGFNGKPAFITDYDKYFLNAADEVAGGFISDSNLAQLCQPLRMPVKFILDLSYRQARDYRERSQCTLTSAAGNVTEFLDGNFSKGGWSQWFSIVSNPQNNIYGAVALGRSGLYDSVQQQQDIAKTKAEINHGFLNVEDCSSGKCIIVTPGSVISEYLNFSLTVGDRVLIQSDQMNEVIGALFSQLGKQAITGAGGLLGLSYSPDGTTPSYTSQFSNETAKSGFGGSATFITDQTKIEVAYQRVHSKAITDLDAILVSIGGVSCTSGDKVAAAIGTQQATYDAEVQTAQSIIDILNLLENTFATTNDASVKTVIVEQFQKMQSEGTLHTTAEVTEKTFSIADEVTALKTTAQDAITNCN